MRGGDLYRTKGGDLLMVFLDHDSGLDRNVLLWSPERVGEVYLGSSVGASLRKLIRECSYVGNMYDIIDSVPKNK